MPLIQEMQPSADLWNTLASRQRSPAVKSAVAPVSGTETSKTQWCRKRRKPQQAMQSYMVVQALTVSKGPALHMPVTMITPAFRAASTSRRRMPTRAAAFSQTGQAHVTKERCSKRRESYRPLRTRRRCEAQSFRHTRPAHARRMHSDGGTRKKRSTLTNCQDRCCPDRTTAGVTPRGKEAARHHLQPKVHMNWTAQTCRAAAMRHQVRRWKSCVQSYFPRQATLCSGVAAFASASVPVAGLLPHRQPQQGKCHRATHREEFRLQPASDSHQHATESSAKNNDLIRKITKVFSGC